MVEQELADEIADHVEAGAFELRNYDYARYVEWEERGGVQPVVWLMRLERSRQGNARAIVGEMYAESHRSDH